jgi:hypothetical protein
MEILVLKISEINTYMTNEEMMYVLKSEMEIQCFYLIVNPACCDDDTTK